MFKSHNPCFSRILFAMKGGIIIKSHSTWVTILVLVEYSLQFKRKRRKNQPFRCHNPCFSRILFAIVDLLFEEFEKFKSQSLF